MAWIFDKLFNRKIEGESSLDGLPEQVAGKADKSYVDKSFVKRTSKTSGNYLYGSENGLDNEYSIAKNTYPSNSIAQRTIGGALFVGAPTADNHASTKKYVDDAVAGAGGGGTKLCKHTISLPDNVEVVLITNSLTQITSLSQLMALAVGGLFISGYRIVNNSRYVLGGIVTNPLAPSCELGFIVPMSSYWNKDSITILSDTEFTDTVSTL